MDEISQDPKLNVRFPRGRWLDVAVAVALIAAAAIAVMAGRGSRPSSSPAGRPGTAAAPALLPSTVRTRIPLPFGQPGDMTILGSTAWISDWSASQIVGVDLAAGRVTRTLHVGDWQDEPVSMTSGAGSLWVLDFSGPLLRIDPASGAITRRFPVRGLGADIAYGDGFIWVITDEPAADGGQEYLDKIDPSRGVIVKEAPVPGAGPACAVSPGPQGIWIGCAGVDRITSINQGSLQPAESLRVDSGGYTPQIVPGRNAVWVLTPSGLARADPATGQITWCRLLGLYDCDDLKNAEPGTLRYRLPSLPARLVRHARASSARAGRAPGTARCWRAFSGESNRSYNETSRPGMTASSGRAGRPLRPAAVLNGTHRLLPAAGPRHAGWLRSLRPARATPAPPPHSTFGPSRLMSVPSPVLRPLLTSARSALTSRCEPLARRHDSTTSTRADLPG